MSASVHPLRRPALDYKAEIAALDTRLAQLAGIAPPEAGPLPEWQFAPLAEAFSLSEFQQRALLFAAMAELRGETQALLTKFGEGPPSVGLLMRLCGDGSEWSGLAAEGALRRGCLLALGDPDAPFTRRPVRVEESVLQALHGEQRLDPAVQAAALVLPQDIGGAPAREAVAMLVRCLDSDAGVPPPVEIVGADADRAIGTARAALAELGLGTVAMPVDALPQDTRSLRRLQDLWLRDAILHRLGLVLVGKGVPVGAELVTGWGTPVIAVEAPLPAACAPVVCNLPGDGDDHADLWRESLPQGAKVLADRLAYTFRLGPATIRALGHADGKTADGKSLWRAAAAAARPRDATLFERIEPSVTLDQVVLPPETADILDAIVQAGMGQHRVARDWGGRRGLGVTALFSGESGTGKTMAAEGIAQALGLELYRVELSAVVSKYIGETERNLRRVFASVADAGGVLLFDEADALFGQRSEIRDSHDRYANMEVGYLLQQMEAFRGIALLTTNMPDSIDSAFTRRLRFVARFPMPGAAERRRIWEGAFPASVARADMDFERLSRLSLTGAVIRNIALGACFRAAGEARDVLMDDVLAAARMELAKLERPLAEIDGRDWS